MLSPARGTYVPAAKPRQKGKGKNDTRVKDRMMGSCHGPCYDENLGRDDKDLLPWQMYSPLVRPFSTWTSRGFLLIRLHSHI